ncbi:MAG: glutamine synthetase III [Bacteroidia bacterium]|nr:glutamine synthetase III [Bacteroidia bacterium]
MENTRHKALEVIQSRKPSVSAKPVEKVSEIFGQHVFTLEKMKTYLERDIYDQMAYIIEHGETLDRSIADKVANAIKIWAMEKGATHYTHWFQPLTGLTAEKHDAFFDLEKGEPVERFSGGNLAQAEPDASSFPSGGIRNTFEARGYTAWDPSSPAFIFENRFGKTLCIPTIFVSYTGEALDFKAPLLKSMEALNQAAVPVCQLFDRNITRVVATLGAEQEYFLVDRSLYDLRPDLVLTGRTLLGHRPARGQQLDDHYFGSISERVFAFMKEFETEAYKLGIPLTTRHNEVAPSQFECAPIFEEINVAVDHNQLLMDLMDRVASNHNFKVLLHEKPFAGINGSGKHNNWSMGTNTGKNLLSPGSNPKDNLMFLTFFVNIIKAVHDHADLLRASIASASNDHRLGANEAPPAIISAFIGSQLTEILDELEKPSRKKLDNSPKSYLKLGISKIPEILLDNTDRNRTSPFAFTGNKFEFRAVGSSANNSAPMTVLNTIVADQLVEFKKTLERKTTRGKKKETAILEILRAYIKDSKNVRFEGNGYSQEWVEEAERRGLSNIKKTPRALDAYVTDSSLHLFARRNIFTPKEAHARHDIMLDHYIMKVQIEARVLGDLCMNQVIPATISYLNQLLSNVQAMKAAGLDKSLYAAQTELVSEISGHLNAVKTKVDQLVESRKKANSIAGTRDRAIAYADEVLPFIAEIRYHGDKLESLVSDELWPLPKYREMLFLR